MSREVWVVSSGCIYEGGGVDAIFETEEKALSYTKAKVRKENKYDWGNLRRKRQRLRRLYPEETEQEIKRIAYRRPKYRLKSDSWWDNDSDYICIRAWKVI